MFIRDLAKRIPDEIRSKRVFSSSDPIRNAVPVASNYHMILLAEVWYEFVDINTDKSYCPVCLQTILQNYRAMAPTLLELETQYLKLNSI